MRWAMTRILLAVAALLSLPAVAAAQTPGSFGIVSVTVRPATADVFIDGERWVTSDTSVPLVVRLPPGRHTIDVRARGYRPFATVVDVRAEESTPLNVILPAGPADPGNPPPFAPQPPPSGIHQVSQAPSGDGFVFAPDFKITELNHRTTGFAGMYGGAVFAGQFLLGGGAYVQLDDYNSEQMVYGGLVSEWRLFHDHPVGLTLHGLAGWGEARTGIVYAYATAAATRSIRTTAAAITATDTDIRTATRASSSLSRRRRSSRASAAASAWSGASAIAS